MRRDALPRLVGLILAGVMESSAVMETAIACLVGDRLRLAHVDIYFQRIADGIAVTGAVVLEDTVLVAARDELHAALLGNHVGECHPARDTAGVGLAQPSIASVLMPEHFGRVVRRFVNELIEREFDIVPVELPGDGKETLLVRMLSPAEVQ